MNNNLYDYTKTMVIKEFYTYNLVLLLFLILVSVLIVLMTSFKPLIMGMFIFIVLAYILFYPWTFMIKSN